MLYDQEGGPKRRLESPKIPKKNFLSNECPLDSDSMTLNRPYSPSPLSPREQKSEIHTRK